MQQIVATSRHSNTIRRGFARGLKIAACLALGAFGFQLALGAFGLFLDAPTYEISDRWPELLMVVIGLALLYRVAGSLVFHILGRSPRWAWSTVRSRIAVAVRLRTTS